METIKMEYLDWCEKFKVVCTPDGHEEWEDADLELLRQHDSHYIWTNVSDGDTDVILPGWHSVNRTGTWYLTEVAWEENGVYVYVDLDYEGEPDGICENCGKFAHLWSRPNESDRLCSKCFDKIYYPEDVVEDEEDEEEE